MATGGRTVENKFCKFFEAVFKGFRPMKFTAFGFMSCDWFWRRSNHFLLETRGGAWGLSTFCFPVRSRECGRAVFSREFKPGGKSTRFRLRILLISPTFYVLRRSVYWTAQKCGNWVESWRPCRNGGHETFICIFIIIEVNAIGPLPFKHDIGYILPGRMSLFVR